MVLRLALFVLMALGLLGFGAVAWISTHPAVPVAHTEAVAPPAKMMVLAAAHTLRAGSLLKPEDLGTREFVTAEVPAGATVDSPSARGAMIGAMVRRSMAPDEIVLPSDVVHPGDHGFLAAVLAPGMRAVTVSVDSVSGTAGLIWPGDRVDLILIQANDDHTQPAGHRVGAETVLSDVRVIAIDQHIVQGAAPEAGPNGSKDLRTATLEVTAEQAERVSVAARLGHLSLSVRSAEPGPAGRPDDHGPAASKSPVTWANDVSAALNPDNLASPPTTVHVFQGDGEGKEFKF